MFDDIVIITNNEMVSDQYDNVIFVKGDYIDVLYKARDMVYLNHNLINHPLAASIRMFYSPLRSIALKKGKSESSEIIIDESIQMYKNIMGNRNIDYRNLEDYKLIDLELLKESVAIN